MSVRSSPKDGPSGGRSPRTRSSCRPSTGESLAVSDLSVKSSGAIAAMSIPDATSGSEAMGMPQERSPLVCVIVCSDELRDVEESERRSDIDLSLRSRCRRF
eukprot:scaffold86310_cov31-Tisochrysis_lutea.AAC.2